VEGQKFCPFCGRGLETLKEPERPTEPEPRQDSGSPFVGSLRPLSLVRGQYCPWEDQEALGFLRGIGQTLKQTLGSPGEFFRRLPRTGGLLTPLLYALIVKTTGTLVSFVWIFLLDSPLMAKLGLHGNTAVLAGLTVPVVLFLSVVIEAAVLHGSLFVVGGATEDFEATFRVVCYSAGPELINVVPVVGGWISTAWQVYLLVVGLGTVHSIGTGRSVFAVLLPTLICFGLFAAAVAFLFRSMGLSL
jgi:hypothetical protein